MSTRAVAGALALAMSLMGSAPANAQALAPRSSDLLMSEGQTLYDAGRYKEAAASFERAMQFGVAKPAEAALHVARSYAQLGNAKQARRWVEIAEQLRKPVSVSSGTVTARVPARVLD